MSDPVGSTEGAILAEAQAWVLRLSSGEMDAAEVDRFRAWVAESDAHARAFEQRRSLWLELGAHRELFEGAAASRAEPHRRRARRDGVQRRRIAVAAAAAGLAMVLTLPEAKLRFSADHSTSSGVREFSLPDGSVAWLDAHSAIGVDFDASQRKVTLLRGAAWFDVRHGEDRPFKVVALANVVEDIGTSFEVRREPRRVRVAVTEGAVRVTPTPVGGEAVVLRQGEGADYDASGDLRRRSVSASANVAAWRRHELMLDRRSLPDAIAEIGRYRPGPTWVWADLSDREAINAALRIDDPDAALRDLAAVHGLTVDWLPGGVAIVRSR